MKTKLMILILTLLLPTIAVAKTCWTPPVEEQPPQVSIPVTNRVENNVNVTNTQRNIQRTSVRSESNSSSESNNTNTQNLAFSPVNNNYINITTPTTQTATRSGLKPAQNQVNYNNSSKPVTNICGSDCVAANTTRSEENRRYIQQLKNEAKEARTEARAGTALAASLNYMTPTDDGKTTMSVGAAYFEGETALSLTAVHRFENSDINLMLGGATTGEHTLATIGIGWEF